MQTKKILGIALAAALVGSMATVAVSARDAMDAGEEATYFDSHTIGIVGGMTGWGTDPDVAMTDADGDGIYTGVVKGLAVGDYEFKVRADSAWDDSWGEYEADYERTFNSQTNCSVSVTQDDTDLIVSLDTNGEDGNLWPVSYTLTSGATATNYGIVGSMTGWGSDPDVVMYDLGDNKVGGKLDIEEAGTYEFKVRADSAWDLSWGVYEADYDRTQNSQTNCSVTVDGATTLFVVMDTTDEENDLWPITYYTYGDDGVVTTVYTGKVEEVIEESSEEESSQEESSQDESSEEESSQEESSKDESSQEESSKDESSAEPEYYVSQKSDYVYFDNSETKWDKVYAYWWNSDYSLVVDKLTGKDYPEFYTEPDENGKVGQDFANWYPGQEMTQIPGTDIWQVRVPYGATMIIFNSGVSDAEVREGVEAYQTLDLQFSDTENAGQIYTIDINGELKPGRGIEKTKYKYQVGSWSTYDGEYVAEEFGSKPVDPSELLPETSNEDSKNDENSENSDTTGGTTTGGTTTGGTTTGGTTTGGTTTGGTTDGKGNSIATGDNGVMPIAIATVAVAALGVAFVAAKKKSSEE